MELPLPLLLLDLELPSRLLLAGIRRRRLRGPLLLLLHAQLERILLLLPLQLILLQGLRAGIIGGRGDPGKKRADERGQQLTSRPWNGSCNPLELASVEPMLAVSYPSNNIGLRHQCDSSIMACNWP